MKNDEISNLIRYRMEQAQIALDDARFLLDGKRSPQSIINRSYYAMFYATLALLQKIRKVPSRHTGVISLFDTEFVLKGVFPKELSKDFHKTFELRQVSNYKVIEPSFPEKAKEALNKAVCFVDAVKEYLLAAKTSV
ncbi:MAG: HEPN domain-containing protein [Deltaproteobacteria bacterium]|nr:HEPN domain-containing protein [Deltaproteobacteria bacterium]